MQESITEGRRVARRRLRAKLPGATEGVIQYVFDEDGFYEGIADKLIEGLPYREVFSARSSPLAMRLLLQREQRLGAVRHADDREVPE